MNSDFLNSRIEVSRSRIHSCIRQEHGVSVITDNRTYSFPNGFLYPGFVDTHGHVVGLGNILTGLNLFNTHSANECINLCIQRGTTRNEWIFGMGWNEEIWSESIMPTKELLDSVFPTTPVYLRRADGHAAWVNSTALRIAGISRLLPDPKGGAIVRDENNEPTGILIDTAMDYVQNHLPLQTVDEIRLSISAAMNAFVAAGLTEVHDMDVPVEYIEIFRSMAEEGALPCRVQSWARGQNYDWDLHGLLPTSGEFQQTLGIKFFADGALGSRGAHLLEPYSDNTTTKGLSFLEEEELFERCERAIAQGFHISTHAIGDAANRAVLNVYEKLRSEGIASENTILRIEHAQIVHPSDILRFKQMNIIAPVQPVHCTSDARMAKERLHQRCRYAYPWKTLLDSGCVITGGSDFPIESYNPLTGIDAFVRRIPFDDSNAWYGSECLSQVQAIDCYTYSAHKASDVTYRRGTIGVGFDADFTILDTNLYDCEPDQILSAKVLATFSAGVLRYSQ